MKASSTINVDGRKSKFFSKTILYLVSFFDEELFRSYFNLNDLIFASQGAESAMNAAIISTKQIFEPLQKIVKIKVAAEQFTSSISPRVHFLLSDKL